MKRGIKLIFNKDNKVNYMFFFVIYINAAVGKLVNPADFKSPQKINFLIIIEGKIKERVLRRKLLK